MRTETNLAGGPADRADADRTGAGRSAERPRTTPRPRKRRFTRLMVAIAALATILALPMMGMLLVLVQRAQDTGEGFTLPLPGQAVAIVRLLENAPPDARPMILSAVNSADVRVSLAAESLSTHQGPAPRLWGLERTMERYLDRYFDALEDREVYAYFGAAPENVLFRVEGPNLWTSAPVKLEIQLRTGEWVRLETQGDLTRRLFAWPLGFGAGVGGLALACFALWVVWRETRPLAGLATRLERFAARATPEPMPLEGPEEVRGVITAFNDLQMRIADLLATRAAMLGALGHDLRTYLTRLRLRAEFIQPEEQAAKARSELDQMERALASALDFARLHAAALDLAPTPLDPLLAEALAAFDMVAPESGLVLKADRDGLRRVFDNLFENAARYAGVFSLEIRAQDGCGVVRVLDRGPGWPVGDRERLLSAFERGDAARNLDQPGSGLGLAIVAGLLSAMDGEIQLLDREGGGAVVEIRLPLA